MFFFKKLRDLITSASVRGGKVIFAEKQSQFLVRLKNIKKDYGKKQVLRGIDLLIRKGDRIALVGGNGSGKTTLCEIIAGVKAFHAGKITYSFSKNELAYEFSINFQEQKWPSTLKVGELISFFSDVYSKKKINNFFLKKKQFDINNKFIMKKISELSGGELQRFNLFISLFNNPQLFIGDEITSGLDITNRIKITQSIKQEKKMTLLLVTHNWEEIHHLCQRIIFLKDGLIFCEKKVSDFENYNSFSQYFSSVYT